MKFLEDLWSHLCGQEPPASSGLMVRLRKMWGHVKTERTPVLLKTCTLALGDMGLHLG